MLHVDHRMTLVWVGCGMASVGAEMAYDRRLNLRLSTETYEAYEAVADLERKSVSAVVRDILEGAAPDMQRLAAAIDQVQGAISRGVVQEAALGVALFQQLVQGLQGEAASAGTIGEIIQAEIAAAASRQQE